MVLLFHIYYIKRIEYFLYMYKTKSKDVGICYIYNSKTECNFFFIIPF